MDEPEELEEEPADYLYEAWAEDAYAREQHAEELRTAVNTRGIIDAERRMMMHAWSAT